MEVSPGVRVSTAVLTRPAWKARVDELRSANPDLDVDVVLDQSSDGWRVSPDADRIAWSRVPADATHHLVLHDDVVLCADFGARLRQALAVAPAGVNSLFADRGSDTAQAVRLATLTGGSWTPVVDAVVPERALLMPAVEARRYCEFARRNRDARRSTVLEEFLVHRRLTAYVSVPDLVDVRRTVDPDLDELLHGSAGATVSSCAGDQAGGDFRNDVVAPPAIAVLGVGGFDAFCHYVPLVPGTHSRTSMGHEVLITLGVSMEELAEGFAIDLDYHPEVTDLDLGKSLLFQLWATLFIQGAIARGCAGDGGVELFDAALAERPMVRAALATFVGGALRGTLSSALLSHVSEKTTSFCVASMRSGFAALDNWPDLRALSRPDEHVIRPRWNVSRPSDEDSTMSSGSMPDDDGYRRSPVRPPREGQAP